MACLMVREWQGRLQLRALERELLTRETATSLMAW